MEKKKNTFCRVMLLSVAFLMLFGVGKGYAASLTLWLSAESSKDVPIGNTQPVSKMVYLYLKDDEGNGVKKRDCDLTSSDMDVATISETGDIDLKAGGTTTITAVRKSDSATGSLEITVEDIFNTVKFSIKGKTGGTLTVNQGSVIVDHTTGNGSLDATNGLVTFKAAPESGRRVAWYINGIKLQGQSFNVPNVSPALNWYNATDVGKLSDAAAINRVYLLGGGEADRNREETLTITQLQLANVNDVQVEFIKDIAHLANITFSSEGNSEPNNGYHGAVVVDRAVWMVNHSGTERWIEFDLKSNKDIEKMELRRRTRMNCKTTKYTISFPETSIPDIKRKLDARDGSNEIEDKTDPFLNGDMDDVVSIPGGSVSIRKVRVTITEYKKRDGTAMGATADEHQPGFERIKIIEKGGASGIKEIFVPNVVNISPNPFTDVLNITGAENSMLQVTNTLGMTVYSQKISGADETLSFRQLPAGIYFFSFEKNGQTKTLKAIKK